MTCIDDLFDWLLEEIFIKLPPSDRLICKEVSKRWNTILMESYLFKKDRHIVLSTDEIKANEPPMTVLMETNPYQIYTIGSNCKENSDILQFFDCVGPYIRELTLKLTTHSVSFLTTMSSLRSLTLNNSFVNHAVYRFSSVKQKNRNFFFQQLEKLQIHMMMIDKESLNDIKIIKKFIPKNCRIIIDKVLINELNQVEHLLRVMELVKILFIGIMDEGIRALIEVDNMNCDELLLECETEEHPYSLMAIIQNKYHNLRSLKLICKSLPPVAINLSKLTSLTLNFSGPVGTLKSLEQLTNLKDLELEFTDDFECIFGHETIIMPNLKSLSILFEIYCDECFDALSKSFENLNDFTFKARYVFNWGVFILIIDNWKKLEKITTEMYRIDSYDPLPDFEPKEHVCSLSIKVVHGLKIGAIKQLVEPFPNLETIIIETENSIPRLPNFIRALVLTIPKLETFSFVLDYKRSIEVLQTICDFMHNLGFPVENREKICNNYQACERVITIKLNRNRKKSMMYKIMDKIGFDSQIHELIHAFNNDHDLIVEFLRLFGLFNRE